MTTQAQRAATASFDAAAEFEKGRLSMTETDWNWHIRNALQKQGYRAFHIREASENGVADLIVYRQLRNLPRLMQCDLQVVEAWLELKVQRPTDRWDDLVKPAQRELMRDHWRLARNAMFVTFDQTVYMLAVRQGDCKGRVKMYKPNPYTLNWQEVFAHFKARKVSL